MIPSLLEKYLPLSPKSHVGSLKRLASRLLSKKSPPPYLSGSWKYSQCLESLLLCDRYQTGCAFFQPTSCTVWKLTQGEDSDELLDISHMGRGLGGCCQKHWSLLCSQWTYSSQTSQWKSSVTKLQWLKVILSNTVEGLSILSSHTGTWHL